MPLFQVSRKKKAASSSTAGFVRPVSRPFNGSVQTVKGQSLFNLAKLLSPIEDYQILLAGEVKEMETKDHVVVITIIGVRLSTPCPLGPVVSLLGRT